MIDPKSVARANTPEPQSSLAAPRKKAHPWAWLVGLIVTLSLIWGLFGMDHLKATVDPAVAPAVSASAAG